MMGANASNDQKPISAVEKEKQVDRATTNTVMYIGVDHSYHRLR